MKRVGFEGDLAGVLRVHAHGRAVLLSGHGCEGRAAWLADAKTHIVAMRAKLPELFVTLPKAEVVVKAVEPFREKSAGKAFYQRPSLDGTPPGHLLRQPLPDEGNAEVRARGARLSRGDPGPSHAERGRARGNVAPAFPPHRRLHGLLARAGASTASGSARKSASTPIHWSEFGRLAMELHRAVRLVVDTGLHAKRWTREQTIRYHVENSPTGEDAAVRATERYILNPGQATAYMIGMLKIVELRERAAAALGPKFDRARVPRPRPAHRRRAAHRARVRSPALDRLRRKAEAAVRPDVNPFRHESTGTWSYVVADPRTRHRARSSIRCSISTPSPGAPDRERRRDRRFRARARR